MEHLVDGFVPQASKEVLAVVEVLSPRAGPSPRREVSKLPGTFPLLG